MLNLSPEIIEQFSIDGAVLIPGVFTDWVDSLNCGIEKNIKQPGPFVRDYHDEQGGRFFGDYCNWQRISEYRDFIYDSKAADIAKALMQSSTARLFHEHVLVKEPSTDIPTPWHHDQPYYCVDGTQNCSLWLALDDVEKSNGVEFVAGSHRWGRWFRPERFDNSPLYENDQSRPLPNIDDNRDDYNILGWDVKAGDVIAFHYLTLHGAAGNGSSEKRRRAFSSRWVGDDATFAVRPGKTSPPFPNCKLSHGDPLDGDEFPLIRQ